MKFTAEELLNSSPVCIIATKNKEGKTDAMTTTSARFISLDPKLISFAVSKDRYTLKNLWETREFTTNIPGENLLEGLWKIGTQSFLDNEEKVKESGLETEESVHTNSPLIKGSLSSFECRVEELIRAGDHYMVIGEILSTHDSEEEGYPLYHLGGKRFLSRGKVIEVKGKKKLEKKVLEGKKFPYTES